MTAVATVKQVATQLFIRFCPEGRFKLLGFFLQSIFLGFSFFSRSTSALWLASASAFFLFSSSFFSFFNLFFSGSSLTLTDLGSPPSAWPVLLGPSLQVLLNGPSFQLRTSFLAARHWRGDTVPAAYRCCGYAETIPLQNGRSRLGRQLLGCFETHSSSTITTSYVLGRQFCTGS